MKGFLITFGLVLALQFFVVAGTVMAADATTTGGLAQLSGCSGPDCTACNVVDMMNGIIKWLIGIMFILCAVLLTVAGVRLVTSGGNSHTLDEAKGMLTNAIIGMIIILAAWLIIDTVMRGLVGSDGKLATDGDVSGWLFWSQVQCQIVRPPEFDKKNTLNMSYEGAQVEYFSYSGINSYQGFVYNAAQSCKQVASASFPDMAMCQTAMQSVLRSNGYIVQDCSGAAGTAALPSWNTAPVCGGVVASGGAMTLSLRSGGTVPVKACDTSALMSVNFLGGSIQIHKNLVASARRIDSAWRSRGGDSFYNVTSVGGYNCRKIAGSSNYSVHAYGLAIDINPAQNPQGSTLITNMPSEFVRILTNEGWGWGGNWRSSKDAMHYSKATNEQGNMVGE